MLSRKSADRGGSTPVDITIQGAPTAMADQADFRTQIDPKQLTGCAALDAYRESMRRNGQKKSTIDSRYRSLRTIARHVDILDPEAVKALLATRAWSENTKCKRVEDLQGFFGFKKISWAPPWYRRTEKLPFVPTETEVDQLIENVSRVSRHGGKTAAFLQLLKETGLRPGEAWSLRWTDVNFEQAHLVLNDPEKGSNPRNPRISSKLIQMLNGLQRSSPLLFRNQQRDPIKSLEDFRRTYIEQRKRAAETIGNSRINSITFKTLRHFKATIEYHRTKDILHVMRLLGHRSIKNTLVYTHLVPFHDDEFVCKTAATVQDATALIEAGFEHVTDIDGLKLFRKRK
jgi:integrase